MNVPPTNYTAPHRQAIAQGERRSLNAPPHKMSGGSRVDVTPHQNSTHASHLTSPTHGTGHVLCHSDRFLGKAEEATRQLLRSWCDYGPKQINQIDPDMMPGIFPEVAKGILDAMLNHEAKDFAGVYVYFMDAPQSIRDELCECNQGNSPRPQDCRPLLEIIRRYDTERKRDILAGKLRLALDHGDDTAEIMREYAALESGNTDTTLSDALSERAFDFDSHPEKPIPLFRLTELPLCTPGNLTNIQAPAKAGKSAVMESMMAAVMDGNRQGQDTLCFSAENPLGHALIHFDTEQSRFDHDALIRRACRRARVERPQAWFMSYSVADLDIYERRQALRQVMAEAGKLHGGIFAVMIDGIGDLCANPNDAEEAFELVHELHALAIRHHCTICTVLHENPGSENGKTRGHLGSQLERKAETNLRLAKDADGLTTIWAERARHCYLPKEHGPCFSWNDQAGMHTSCGTSGEIKAAAIREKMQNEAETAFGDAVTMSYGELVSVICERLNVSERTAKSRIKSWLAEGITRKNTSGNHLLAGP